VLIDTSVLLRTLQPGHAQREIVRSAIKILTAQGKDLHIVPQNLIELWVVATRPVEQNGLGMTPSAAGVEVTRLQSMFELLPETSSIYAVWERLVIQHQVCGKPAHDARLVAAMYVHGIKDILTFDRTGFTRYTGIEVVSPADAAASAT
jgi:predicted nucleic acid-binding protein